MSRKARNPLPRPCQAPRHMDRTATQGSLTEPSFPPPASQAQTCVEISAPFLLQEFPSQNFSYRNKILAGLILSWHLLCFSEDRDLHILL